MSAHGVLTLRIFSGPHLGAELVLPAGTHSIGSDASCDIILHDSSLAARHVQLVISETEAAASQTPSSQTENPSTPEVRLVSLDGPALVNGEALPNGENLAPYTPCFLGLTCFAWGGLGQQEAGWRAVSSALHEAPQRHTQNAAPDTAQNAAEKVESAENSATPTNQEQDTERATLPTMEGTPANNLDSLLLSGAPKKPLRTDKLLRIFLFFLVILALCGLTITYEGYTPNKDKQIEIIKKSLSEAGFESLQIEQREPGFTIFGPLQNDAERGALVKLAQSMHYPVYLDVEVRTDRVNAITTAFNSRKIFPLVWEQPSDKGNLLNIAGYMKDGLVEEWAFSALIEDVPELAAVQPETITRSIRHAEAVEAILAPALEKAQLNFVQVTYLPGTIEIIGAFDVEQRRQLDAVLDHTRIKLGIPLNITVRSPTPEAPRQQAAGTAFGVPVKKKESGLSGLNVSGVTMKPMRFVSLATGERIFEGGMLPGGYILESIDIRELKLSKDGRLTVYQLRGSNE